MPKLSDFPLDKRDEYLKRVIERKKDQRGTADEALTKMKRVNHLPLEARDERQALMEALRDVKHDATDDIEQLRKALRRVRKHQHEQADKPDGAEAAVKFALSQVGVVESPAGSNWGHPVEDWIKRTGYTFAVPWCGCFAHECVVEVGGAAISVGVRMGYGPSIIADAKAGANGFRAVPFADAQPGDVLVFWGGEHIGLCRGRPSGLVIPTVEGNTSPSSAGSQYNGGCVAAKSRNSSDVSVVARPNYEEAR